VGADPEGSRPETVTLDRFVRKPEPTIAQVPLPACDPVHGPGGPLFTYWRA
jgi:hypothetical protein